MRERTSRSESEEAGALELLVDDPEAGDPVRKGLLVDTNFAARASGEGSVIQRGWRMEIIRDTSESELSKAVDGVRRCETEGDAWVYE